MAREEAIRLQHDYVGTEHILLGLIREGEGVAAAVLTNLDVDLEQVHERVEELVRKGKATIALGDLPYTSRAKKVLEFAMAEARELSHSYVGTEHLLLGLLREEKGIAAQVLNSLAVTLEDARARRRSRSSARTSRPPSPPGSPVGDGGRPDRGRARRSRRRPRWTIFCRDLTDLARQGEARPDDRTGIRDRARHRDPLPPEEEQPRPHRGPGRRQDRHRRGARTAHRPWRRDGGPQGSPGARTRHGGGHRRHEVPRVSSRSA